MFAMAKRDNYIWQPGERIFEDEPEERGTLSAFWFENWKFIITTGIAIVGLLIAGGVIPH
jgi:hypothetical protein